MNETSDAGDLTFLVALPWLLASGRAWFDDEEAMRFVSRLLARREIEVGHSATRIYMHTSGSPE